MSLWVKQELISILCKWMIHKPPEPLIQLNKLLCLYFSLPSSKIYSLWALTACCNIFINNLHLKCVDCMLTSRWCDLFYHLTWCVYLKIIINWFYDSVKSPVKKCKTLLKLIFYCNCNWRSLSRIILPINYLTFKCFSNDVCVVIFVVVWFCLVKWT